MVIDDLANRKHDCELLLDQNLVQNYQDRYFKLLPKNSNTLLGPKYALLQNEYKKMHKISPTRKGPVKCILVYFGACDSNHIIKQTINSYIKLNRDDIKLNVVIHPNRNNKNIIENFSKKKNIKIF